MKILMIIIYLFICSNVMALEKNPITYKDLIAGLYIRSKFSGEGKCKEINSAYYKYLTKEGKNCKLRINSIHMWVECDGVIYDAAMLERMGQSTKE